MSSIPLVLCGRITLLLVTIYAIVSEIITADYASVRSMS